MGQIMKILVTGGAGFIGSELAKFFSKQGHDILILDNLVSGNKENIQEIINKKNVTFFNLDCTSCEKISEQILDCDLVFHFSANPDIRKSQNDPDIDFNNNIVATYELLKCFSKSKKLKKFVFASSSVIYGEPSIIPTKENYGPLMPISFYGASKLACEALISSFSENNDFNFVIFRFANIIGPQSNHGVIFDFIKKLKTNPNELEILGDGKQSKSYLHISDCIDGIVKGMDFDDGNMIFNLGTNEQTSTNKIAKIIVDEMKLMQTKFTYKTNRQNGRGWSGDITNMMLDCTKIRSFGWVPKYSSDDAIKQTAREFLNKNG